MAKKAVRGKPATAKATFRVARNAHHGYSVARGASLSTSLSAAQSAFSKAVSRPSKATIHVVPHKGSWAVRREKNPAVKTFTTQSAAIKAAGRLAKPEKATVIIHARSGQFRDSRRY